MISWRKERGICAASMHESKETLANFERSVYADVEAT
jgi:hypothetical protein